MRPLNTSKASCMHDFVKPNILDINPQQIIFHVGNNNLRIELTSSAKSIIDLYASLRNEENARAVFDILPMLDDLNPLFVRGHWCFGTSVLEF